MPLHSASTQARVACSTAEVLVIDDDVHFRELARNLLQTSGIQVLEAHSVPQGLALLDSRGEHIDAVVLDLVLPDVDGIQAIRQLKAAFPGVKLVTVSGADSCGTYLSISSHLGADAVLAKAQVEALPALLMDVLDR